jgi:hypothetical protein
MPPSRIVNTSEQDWQCLGPNRGGQLDAAGGQPKRRGGPSRATTRVSPRESNATLMSSSMYTVSNLPQQKDRRGGRCLKSWVHRAGWLRTASDWTADTGLPGQAGPHPDSKNRATMLLRRRTSPCQTAAA